MLLKAEPLKILMAVWSKALPLTASCLSPFFGFESNPGHVRKLAVTWGKTVVFAGYFSFLPPPSTTG